MNWGRKITVVLIGFIGFILILVYKMMSTKIDVVNPNYYEEELKFQGRIDKINNLEQMETQPEIRVDQNKLYLNFHQKLSEGTLEFYKPDNNEEDQKIKLPSGQMIYELPIENKKRGRWVIKIDWKSGGEMYFLEKSVIF